MLACVQSWLAGWSSIALLAVGWVVLGRLVWGPMARRKAGPDVPGLASLRALLEDGRYRGVPVREEPPGPYGGGRWVPGVGEIRLASGMLARHDVDALMILGHERTHADRDWPAPRWYRLALVAAFLVALALGLNGRIDVALAQTAMAAAYLIVAGHALRNELVASFGAFGLTRGWPNGLTRAAVLRLLVGLFIHLGDWALVGLIVLGAMALVACR